MADVCLNHLLRDSFDPTIRKEARKCIRYCLTAYIDQPLKQKSLFLLTYSKLIEDLDSRKESHDAEEFNFTLKQIYRMVTEMSGLMDQNLPIFTPEESKIVVDKMYELI